MTEYGSYRVTPASEYDGEGASGFVIEQFVFPTIGDALWCIPAHGDTTRYASKSDAVAALVESMLETA